MAEDYLRDKDRELGGRCREAATAAAEAVEWLAANRPASARLSSLQKQLRREAVEARRLAVAAERPMSVGVFGASQQGKSFLIGKLITPPGRPVKVIFGSGEDAVRQDFLKEVNPAGGDETTGLVTRFSLRSHRSPPGYPVVLRTLREVDIAKILVNSFYFDLDGEYDIQIGPDKVNDLEKLAPTAERIAALADMLAPLRQASPQPGFPLESVFELRAYIEGSLTKHLLVKERDLGEIYWNFLEETLPWLDGAGRVRALSLLWAELAEFNDLYLTLKRALDQLGHPSEIYAPLSALADRARGVLHVDALNDLDVAGAVAQIGVLSRPEGGAVTPLPVAVASALTSELFLTLEETPWDFFTHTDLLDFPGARSRELASVWQLLRSPEARMKQPRSQCFRRGKVAVLFDNYVADLDLNAMLLCKDQNNQEVRGLEELVLGWVNRTHGERPEDRRGKPPALFFCMTKCDTMLGVTEGNDDPVHKRFENNLTKSFSSGWVKEWEPGRPFRNVFMLRNPSIECKGFFSYEPPPPDRKVGDEKGYLEEFALHVETSVRPKYLANELVRMHVEDAAEKLEALLTLNDGGSTLLAQRLAPICNPDLKYDQIAPRAERAIDSLRQSLTEFYETGDIEKRVNERVGRMRLLTDALKRRRGEIGPFIASFMVEEPLIEAAYLDHRRNAGQSAAEENVFDDLFGDEPDAPPAARNGFGPAVVGWWASHLTNRVAGSPWCEVLGVDEEMLRGFVDEIVIGADRIAADRMLEERLDEYTLSSLHLGAAARRVSIFGTLTLNDLISFPGGREQSDNAARFAPPVAPAPGAICDLPENPRDLERTRLTYFADWLRAVEDLARSNASSGQQGVIDVEANARMGRILDRLGGAPQ